MLQPPAPQILIPAQAVSAADVAAKGFPPVAAIEANHIVVPHGLAHRDSGGEHFFDRSLSSKLAKASVHGGDEVRKLTSPDCIMSQVAPDDFCREKRIDALGIHGSLRDLFSIIEYTKSETVETEEIIYSITHRQPARPASILPAHGGRIGRKSS